MEQDNLFTGCEANNELFEEFYKDENFRSIIPKDKILADKEFYKCSFEGCQFSNIRFESCRFENCNFIKCDFSNAQLNRTNFIDIEFKNCKLIGLDWTVTRPPLKINFESCKLNHSSFVGRDLRGTKWIDCELNDIDFAEANMSSLVFHSCDFLRSKFVRTNLMCADFSESVNYNLNPVDNKIQGAVFSAPEVLNLLESFNIIIK